MYDRSSGAVTLSSTIRLLYALRLIFYRSLALDIEDRELSSLLSSKEGSQESLAAAIKVQQTLKAWIRHGKCNNFDTCPSPSRGVLSDAKSTIFSRHSSRLRGAIFKEGQSSVQTNHLESHSPVSKFVEELSIKIIWTNNRLRIDYFLYNYTKK